MACEGNCKTTPDYLDPACPGCSAESLGIFGANAEKFGGNDLPLQLTSSEADEWCEGFGDCPSFDTNFIKKLHAILYWQQKTATQLWPDIDSSVVENIKLPIVGEVDGECVSGLADAIPLFRNIFDAQTQTGVSELFLVQSDVGRVLLQNGTTGIVKRLTANKDGDYLVSVKGKVESAGRIAEARLSVGINGDSAGAITVCGWANETNNTTGDYWISGSRTFPSISTGDTVDLFGNGITDDGSVIGFSLLTISIELAL